MDKRLLVAAAVCITLAAALGVWICATRPVCALSQDERRELCSDLGPAVARAVERERGCRVPELECID